MTKKVRKYKVCEVLGKCSMSDVPAPVFVIVSVDSPARGSSPSCGTLSGGSSESSVVVFGDSRHLVFINCGELKYVGNTALG